MTWDPRNHQEPSPERDLFELCALVRRIRKAQTEYFNRRGALALGEGMKLERELDALLARIEEEHQK